MHWVVVSNFAFFSAAFFLAGWGHTKRGGGLASLPLFLLSFLFLVWENPSPERTAFWDRQFALHLAMAHVLLEGLRCMYSILGDVADVHGWACRGCLGGQV